MASALEELEQIVAQGESTLVEFKTSTGQRTDAAKAVCGMLNGSGGFVLFGVRDNGRIVGQQVTAETLESVARELRRIEPNALVAPETVECGDGRVVVLVRVPKGGGGPYTYDGRAYARVGPTTVVMSQEEYRQLLLERMQPVQRWENQPAVGIRLEDLDEEEIVRTADEAIRRQRMNGPRPGTVEELLLGFGLFREGQILNAAVVLFGRRARLLPHYPQCYLRLARFRGRDVSSDFDDNRQDVGNAFDLYHRAQQFLRDHLPVAGRVVPNLYERVDDPLYPPVALREALANAFCHRDYSVPGGSVGVAVFDDRLEILSTGPLRFGLKPNDLLRPHPSMPWNPIIASVFYLRGYIEKWGRGTLKMAELTELAGLHRPQFDERNGEVVVRFFPSRYLPPTRVPHEVTPIQRSLLLALAEHGPASSVKLTMRLGEGHSNSNVLVNLNHLRHLGLIEKVGVTRGAVWRLIGQQAEIKHLPESSAKSLNEES